MHSDTHYGDYPRFAPSHPTKAGQHTGWMLLSYRGKTTLSTSQMQIRKSTTNDDEVEVFEIPIEKDGNGEILSEVLTDESPKSYWVAEANDRDQWVKIEMQQPGKIYAIQLNFHDHESGIYTRVEGLRHRFLVESSQDGSTWQTVIDRSESYKDAPNAYEVLKQPIEAKFVRYRNVNVPGPNLALSEIRVFGLGLGKKPEAVKNFKLERQSDRRDAALEWEKVDDAQGYNIRWGIAPDKLYHSWLVYEANSLFMRNLDRDTEYYFSIESFNENGISVPSKILKVE